MEKHAESLLRKTGARSRTGLVAAASQAAARDPQRAFSSLGHYVVPAGIYVLSPM